MNGPMLSIFTDVSDVRGLIREQLRTHCGELNPRRIVVKPNWVQHEIDPAFSIESMVTDANVIIATVEAALDLFPQVETVQVGDCPLQSADWEQICSQSGLAGEMARIVKSSDGRVSFHDWRREVFVRERDGFLAAAPPRGDALEYREVSLGSRSHLEPISDQSDRFAVSDYSNDITSSNHKLGDHRYLVTQSVLDADLVINLPKWKTHAKAGLTAALKNVVGINVDKGYLPHFRRGAPRWGGDEYADENRWLYWVHTTVRNVVQKRSRLAFRALKPGWELIKRVWNIETRMTDVRRPPEKFYAASGGWHGNETIWRMIYDLNLVVQCADSNGQLQTTPQRHYFCIIDGLVAGEGNGPLQALPRKVGWLAFGKDPFALDHALAWFMGFSPNKLPVVARRAEYLGPVWGAFDGDTMRLMIDNRDVMLVESNVNLMFTPPPGWRNHIER